MLATYYSWCKNLMRLERLASLAKNYYDEFIEAYKDYLAGRERVYAVERLAQLLAQTILDYAAVLASRQQGVKPSTYKSLAKYLAQKLKLSNELIQFLIDLAGFRNLLVHAYAEIDKELEAKAFNEIADKTPAVLEEIERYARGDPCLDDVLPRIRRVAEKKKLRYVVLFGSLARNGCGEDVDLFVKLGREPRSLLEIGGLLAEFEDELRCKVDLVVYEAGVDPVLAKTIVDEGVIVYGDEVEAREDMYRLYKQALDHALLLKKLNSQ